MSAVAAPIQKKVATEAATIYCEYRGRGPLQLLIPGAMEDAGFYSTAADILAEKFTVVCYDRRCNSRSSGNVDFFFKHEFRAFFAYIPHIESMRNNKVKMVTAIGKESDNAYYVQATRVLAAKLGCATIEFPGHHDVSFWMPEEFASAILGTLERFYMS